MIHQSKTKGIDCIMLKKKIKLICVKQNTLTEPPQVEICRKISTPAGFSSFTVELPVFAVLATLLSSGCMARPGWEGPGPLMFAKLTLPATGFTEME